MFCRMLMLPEAVALVSVSDVQAFVLQAKPVEMVCIYHRACLHSEKCLTM